MPSVRPIQRSRSRSVVVTAGPTREHVDPVRFITNESSGRMGFAIAAEAARVGHEVVLIAGPVHLPTPAGVRRIDVVSARDMLAAVEKAFPGADALFMAAAVADWRPKRRLAGKWRAKDGGSRTARIDLVRNPDILATVAKRKNAGGKRRLVVGFALETGNGLARARAKLAAKNADFIVLNDSSALNATRASVILLGSDGSVRRMTDLTKVAVARALVRLVTPRRA